MRGNRKLPGGGQPEVAPRRRRRWDAITLWVCRTTVLWGAIAAGMAAAGADISRAEVIVFPLITSAWAILGYAHARRAREARRMLDLILSFDLPTLMSYTKGGNRELPPEGGNRG